MNNFDSEELRNSYKAEPRTRKSRFFYALNKSPAGLGHAFRPGGVGNKILVSARNTHRCPCTVSNLLAPLFGESI